METIKIYVGTYAKYNSGSIFGKWLTIQDYDSLENLYKAMAKIHSDEEDPEYMIQDICGPSIVDELNLISECHINKNIYEVIDAIENSNIDLNIVEAYLKCFGFYEKDIEALIENVEEAYCGEYNSDIDFVYDRLEIDGEIPENLPSYICIDWGKTAQCVMQDYVSDNDYYFRYL